MLLEDRNPMIIPNNTKHSWPHKRKNATPGWQQFLQLVEVVVKLEREKRTAARVIEGSSVVDVGVVIATKLLKAVEIKVAIRRSTEVVLVKAAPVCPMERSPTMQGASKQS